MAQEICRAEPGSGVEFGPFDSDFYYDIENTKDVRFGRGKTLRSVECVVLKGDKLLFIEAKKTAPKRLSARSSVDLLSQMIRPCARAEYEKLLRSLSIAPAYVADVCEKFLTSLCLVFSIAEGRVPSDEMGPAMKAAIRDPAIVPVFVLVITWSTKDWVRNVQDAFHLALQKFEKTNRARVIVLTAEQAKAKGLVHTYEPRPIDTDLL